MTANVKANAPTALSISGPNMTTIAAAIVADAISRAICGIMAIIAYVAT